MNRLTLLLGVSSMTLLLIGLTAGAVGAMSNRPQADPSSARSALPTLRSDPPRTTPTAGEHTKPATGAGRVAAAPPTARPATPDRLTAPRADISMPIVATGVRDDGQMELPPRPTTLGWYQYGPRPGSPHGAAVLAGHVDSAEHGIGPLVRLDTLTVGDRLVVTAGDTRLRYTVTEIKSVPTDEFRPDRIFARSGPPRLHIITCTGRYLPDRGGYQANLIVSATPV